MAWIVSTSEFAGAKNLDLEQISDLQFLGEIDLEPSLVSICCDPAVVRSLDERGVSKESSTLRLGCFLLSRMAMPSPGLKMSTQPTC